MGSIFQKSNKAMRSTEYIAVAGIIAISSVALIVLTFKLSAARKKKMYYELLSFIMFSVLHLVIKNYSLCAVQGT